MPEFELRPFRPDDAAAVADIFRTTIHTVNAADYTPEQRAVWAPPEADAAHWGRRLAERYCLVAADAENNLLGFGDLSPTGGIDRLFVASTCIRQGVGSALLTALEAESRRLGTTVIEVDVSLTARPFFERHGYRIVTPQTVIRRGVELANFRMEKAVG